MSPAPGSRSAKVEGPRERHAAFLRGVSPMNARMPELRAAFEAAGFEAVRTLLSSGNVVFTAPARPVEELQAQAEAAMESRLGKAFMAIVRPVARLRQLLDEDPYRRFELPPGAKRVVTFLRAPPRGRIRMPVELGEARILALDGAEAFSAYVAGPEGPVFMKLIERTFGKDVTTRTWETVRKVAGDATPERATQAAAPTRLSSRSPAARTPRPRSR